MAITILPYAPPPSSGAATGSGNQTHGGTVQAPMGPLTDLPFQPNAGRDDLSSSVGYERPAQSPPFTLK